MVVLPTKHDAMDSHLIVSIYSSIYMGIGNCLGTLFFSLCFFWIPGCAHFPCYLQHWGTGTFQFVWYLQHFGAGTFHVACYAQHFKARTAHFGCYLQHFLVGTIFRMLSAAFWSWKLPCRLPVATFGSWNPAICLHIFATFWSCKFPFGMLFQVVVVCFFFIVDCCLLVVGSCLLQL